MPAKALVPVRALPCIHRYRGHGPLLQGVVDAQPAVAPGCGFCRSGPCPRKRWFRFRRFLAFTAFAAMGRSYRGWWIRRRPWHRVAVSVGAGHARESVGSGSGASLRSPLSRPWAAPTRGGGYADSRGTGQSFCRSGPCPRKRWLRETESFSSRCKATSGAFFSLLSITTTSPARSHASPHGRIAMRMDRRGRSPVAAGRRDPCSRSSPALDATGAGVRAGKECTSPAPALPHRRPAAAAA
jgi:hypothetical protein